MTEKEIIKGCIRCDRRSEFALYEKYYPLMRSLALRYISDKHDALFELNYAFLKVLKSLKKYDHKFPLSSWIKRICINYYIDVYRRRKKINQTEPFEMKDFVVLNEHEYKWQEEDLQYMLRALPNMVRMVFNLFAIEGFAHKEIAEMLNIPIGTSKSHLSIARKSLKMMMERRNEIIISKFKKKDHG